MRLGTPDPTASEAPGLSQREGLQPQEVGLCVSAGRPEQVPQAAGVSRNPASLCSMSLLENLCQEAELPDGQTPCVCGGVTEATWPHTRLCQVAAWKWWVPHRGWGRQTLGAPAFVWRTCHASLMPTALLFVSVPVRLSPGSVSGCVAAVCARVRVCVAAVVSMRLSGSVNLRVDRGVGCDLRAKLGSPPWAGSRSAQGSGFPSPPRTSTFMPRLSHAPGSHPRSAHVCAWPVPRAAWTCTFRPHTGSQTSA